MIVDPVFLKLRCDKYVKKVELNFLVLCRSRGVYPAFISHSVSKQKRGFHFDRNMTRSKAMLLRGAIKDTRASLAKCDMALYKRHQTIASTTNPVCFERMDIIAHSVAWSKMNSRLIVLKHKLRNLTQVKNDLDKRHLSREILEKNPQTVEIPDKGSREKASAICNGSPVGEEILLPSVTSGNTEVTIHKTNPSFVNLSSCQMNDYQKKVLGYNLHFSIAPKVTPTVDLIAHSEFNISKFIPEKDRDFMRAKTRNAIESFRLRSNLTHNRIFKCCETLKKEDIHILKADKGGQTVAIDRTEYVDKTNIILGDRTTYDVIKKDPLAKLVTSLKEVVKSCDSLDRFTKERLVPPNHFLPHFFAVPKLHKDGMPFRPVVSNCGSVYNFVSKFITEKISFLTDLNVHSLKDAGEFLKRLHNLEFHPEDTILSIDIVSLYTSVPTHESIEYLEELLETHGTTVMTAAARADLVRLTRFCIDAPFFRHGDVYYQQKAGLAMGSSLSSPIAEIFLKKVDLSIANYRDRPDHYSRYVDDGFIKWPHGQGKLRDFLSYLNTIHPMIKFTWELEQNGVLPYLDVLITREDNDVTTTVFRKPFASNNPPHVLSNHPWPQKMAAFRSFTDRAHRYCKKPDDLKKEISRIEHIAEERGFPREIVASAVRKSKNMLRMEDTTSLKSQKSASDKFAVLPFVPGLSTTLGKMYKPYGVRAAYTHPTKIQNLVTTHKDRITKDEWSGVYHIPCNCGKTYVGQTRRKFKTRKKEHFLASKSINPQRIETSAVATHVHLHPNHQVDWDRAGIVKRSKPHFLNTLETISVHKLKDKIINGKKDLHLNPHWKTVLDN